MYVSHEGNLVTLINVFETKLEQQQELIDQWIRFVESVTDEPGMIGAALHRSTDGTRVVNYAQWRSEEDFESFVQKYREQMEPVARSLSALTPIFTRSSISLSGEGVDCLSASAGWREWISSLPPRVSSRWKNGEQKRRTSRMAKQYRVNTFVRLNNAVISSMVRRGRKVGSFSLEEFEREVLTHPVFLVQSASEQASEEAGEALP